MEKIDINHALVNFVLTKRLEFMLSGNLSKMGLGKRNQIKPRMPLRYQCSSTGIIEIFSVN